MELTRQLYRAEARRQAFKWITENWRAEPRKLRRAMSMARARLSWRKLIPKVTPYAPENPDKVGK